MNVCDETVKAIGSLAVELTALAEQAARTYAPEVERLISSGNRSARLIEHTLDGLLDFANTDDCLLLYRRLCRYYWTIDPHATAKYVRFYREMWDNDEGDAPSE